MRTQNPLLFIHGAGGYSDDRPLAEALAAELGVRLEMPELPDDDMSVAAWARPVREALRHPGPAHVVAHSFGATILVHVLSSGVRPTPAALLAMPDWSPEGWDIDAYALAPSSHLHLSLHHCRDDEVVPFSHLALNARRLPSAVVHEHDRGGHQFDGRILALAQDLRRGR